ncbi:MAG TPA: DUF1634 domain-containing protein [Coleofasciculaceae cyanobacterium]
MYQRDDSDRYLVPLPYTQAGSKVVSDSNVVALSLQQEASDCVAEALAELSVSVLDNLSDNCEVIVEKDITKTQSDRQLEQFISNLLRYGVLLSSAIVFSGGILYLVRHGTQPANYTFFQGEPSEFCSPKGVVAAALSGSARGIIQFGLLVLIVTPVARVIFSILAFLRRRDFTYLILTLFVLTGLIYSFIRAYV